MIGCLQGIILSKQPNHLLIDVSGVGYEVDISFHSFSQLPEVNQQGLVYTHLIVRDDAHLLFGFAELQERALFRLLIKINGVGPKLALAILSSMEARVLASCVQNQDVATIVKIPGVGKKTAERLLIELRDKMATWQGAIVTNTKIDKQTATSTGSEDEAVSALINLGYKPAAASKAVATAKRANLDASSEHLIRQALRNI